jgi:hypothetical protein
MTSSISADTAAATTLDASAPARPSVWMSSLGRWGQLGTSPSLHLCISLFIRVAPYRFTGNSFFQFIFLLSYCSAQRADPHVPLDWEGRLIFAAASLLPSCPPSDLVPSTVTVAADKIIPTCTVSLFCAYEELTATPLSQASLG